MAQKPEYLIQKEKGAQKWTISKWEGGAEPSALYNVREDEKGKLVCSCPSGLYRGYCKHTSMVRKHERGESE